MSSEDIDISTLRISANRRHVTMVVITDKSYSMRCSYEHGGLFGRRKKKTRQEVANDGACRVVEALGNGDHAAVLAFGDELHDVSGGAVELSPINKSILQRKIKDIKPDGGSTKLYDTVLVGCQMVLSIAAVAKTVELATQEDLGTFWLLILTDGEDNRSSASLPEAKAALNLLSTELGPSIMKIAIIGVQLTDGPRRKLRELATAGGSMATFVDARNLQQVTEAFNEIAVQIEAARLRVGSTATPAAIQDSAPWAGEIQRGMHLRCVGHSRGASVVAVGDVGVVKARDSNGDYIIDFPKKDNWRGRPSDVVIDTTAEEVRPGALVAPKASVTTPVFGWGSYRRGMHGMVLSVQHDGVVLVQFGFDPESAPTDNLWKTQLKELEVIDDGSFKGSFRGQWSGKLQHGQAVRVPARLQVPSTGWGSLKPGEIGYVRAYDLRNKFYVCDFPSADGWKGRAQDLEVDAIATLIRPGKKVRVRAGISTPKYGWRGVQAGSIGTVVSIRYDGDAVIVNFPEDSNWKSTIADLETLDRPPTERLTSVVEGETTCTGGHGLKAFYTDKLDGKVCDFCGRSSGSPGTLMYGCKSCDCDACARCYKPAKPPQTYPDGTVVALKGFNSSSGAPYNGKMAKVISKEGDQYTVKMLEGDKLIKVKEVHLILPRQKHPNGANVKLRGITTNPSLNRSVGTIKGFDTSKGRYTVLCSGKYYSLLPSNIEVLPAAEEVD